MNDNLTKAIERAKGYVSKLTSESLASSGSIDLSKVWQLNDSYITSPVQGGLVVIDQTRAHQRVLYQEVIKSFELDTSSSQTLLFPKKLDLEVSKFTALLDILPYMNKIGFSITKLEENSVMLESIPSDMPWGNEDDVIFKMLDDFTLALKKDIPKEESIALSFSNRACIKHGDTLNRSEMVELINRLFGTDDPYTCPNGQRVLYQIPFNEIEKRFNDLG